MQLLKPDKKTGRRTYVQASTKGKKGSRGLTVYNASPEDIVALLRRVIPEREPATQAHPGQSAVA